MFGFGGGVKNKKFDYIPQHYDPAAEELRQRMSKYGDNAEISDAELAKARIKSGIRMKARGNKEALKEGTKKSNIRLLFVAIGLIVLSLYIAQTDGFAQFLHRILN